MLCRALPIFRPSEVTSFDRLMALGHLAAAKVLCDSQAETGAGPGCGAGGAPRFEAPKPNKGHPPKKTPKSVSIHPGAPPG